MKSRKHYEKLFDPYPDVVTLPEFCNMLGGIGDSTARKTYTGEQGQALLHKMYILYSKRKCDRLCDEL